MYLKQMGTSDQYSLKQSIASIHSVGKEQFKFKPFLVNVSILYQLRTPNNPWFSSVLKGYKMETLARNR